MRTRFKLYFLEAIQSGCKNVVNFSGRASRSEYNYWLLFLLILQISVIIIDPPNPQVSRSYSDNPLNSRLFSFIYFVFIIPSTSLVIRRFHDIGKSGWYVLLPFTIIGIVPYYYWTCFVIGEKKENAYGPNPLNNN
ncbi:MAG: hypothetical protein CMG55_06255 [Candidatus Marinimicrobia bacterium]|nr:hypothetical protein [Candidatus Neomarinimicrobiota bacterium]|tara:strand:- start:3504 stop:3911 length:408 start_codon:yes stop_codon:yes gene_type:complete